MKTAGLACLLAAATLAALPNTGKAQGIAVTPTIGWFIPATDLSELRDVADQQRLEREGTLGLGLNVEAGWVRASLAYATGAKLNDRGITNRGEIGDGSVLALAGDIVLRLPRLIVQPYVLGGGGIKRQDYSYDQDGFDTVFPSEKTDFTLHFGVGADVMLGGIGIVAEVTDFLSRKPDDSFGQHDAFAMVGLKFRFGGN